MTSAPFARRRGGSVQLHVTQGESELLRSMLQHLRGSIDDEHTADVRRLFPPAYTADDEAQAEFRRLTHDDLVDAKRASIEAAIGTLDRAKSKRSGLSVDLDESEVGSWLGVLNDLRLLLGTRLDVTDDLDDREADPNDPRAPAMQMYMYLGWLQAGLVEVLLE